MTTLSADRPSFDPQEDLFGHAPFAKSLASSICSYPDSEGLVLALYGPWGSGKSTVLNYVKHYLELRAEDERPVVVEFNPWWFSGQENLARAFLGQLQVILPAKSEKFKQLGDMLAEFAEELGGLIDLASALGGVDGNIGNLLSRVKRKPKDVPALKESITSILQEAGKRILVVIDDIDRLTPEETRQLFTVIKALADFPNVVYLLAFDRELAALAIEQQTGLPGDSYLKKIVQVPFILPPIDQVALRAAMVKRLDEVLDEIPEGSFDKSYWENVYREGIDPLIRTHRDVVRLTNTLAVTYPAVRGEVNTVDFIALETLRVFLPDLYDVIRMNPDRFSGHDWSHPYERDRNAAQTFKEKWVNEIPEELRASTRALLGRIFPKTGQMTYGPEILSEWGLNLRACHPEVFPIYFRLAVPPGAVSRSDMMALLDLAGTPAKFGEALVQAKNERRPDGLSKARALLERLMDHVEKDIQDAQIPLVIQALLDIGDELIDPADERRMFDIGNVSRVSSPVYHLLQRVETDLRAGVLENAIELGNAVAVQLDLLQAFDGDIAEAKDSGKTTLLTVDDFERLKSVWLDRVRSFLDDASFVEHPELRVLLAAWRRWAGETEVRTWCNQTLTSNEVLLTFVSGFLQYTRSQTMGDRAVHYKPQLDPRWLERYLNIAACADRLRDLKRNDEVPANAQEAVSQYLKEYEIIQEGKNPDGVDAFDD